jgi:pimeloyl-ACP methyl ester carboxylesterase
MNTKQLFAVVFASAAVLSVSAQGGGPADFVGTWKGKLKVGAQSLMLVLNIQSNAGVLSASIDSPDQGAKDIPVSSISVEGMKITVESTAIRAVFEATISADGKSMSGLWKQGGANLPLQLEKGAAAALPKRPQEPQAPFPYTTEEVSIVNQKAGIRLAGTLTIPNPSVKGSPNTFPAVIMVTGSGAQNRDEEIMNHKPFLVIADYLARRGIMSLRCDDRGVGASGGDAESATTYDFADDAEAAFEYLNSRPEVKKGAVGILGHSEGGIIGPIVASRNARVGFLVLLAGPALKGEELLNLQGRAIAKAQGAGEKDIEAALTLNRKLYSLALQQGDAKTLQSEAKQAFLDWAKTNPSMRGMDSAALDSAAEQAVAPIFTPWFREFLKLDPASYLAKLDLPVLALFGSKDLQVPAKENSESMKQVLGTKAAGGPNKKNSIVELKNLNHLFQTAKTGSPDEYGQIEETISPEALKRIADWILGL